MWTYKNIFNLEKKKIYSKIKFNKKIFNKFKNIKLWVHGGGCKGIKYKIKIKKKIKNNDILIKIKNLNFITNNYSYLYIYNSLIKYKKNINKEIIQIKHPNIQNKCNCGYSYNLK